MVPAKRPGTTTGHLAPWQALLVVLVGLGMGLRFYLNTDTGRYKWHKLQLRLPLVGRVPENRSHCADWSYQT